MLKIETNLKISDYENLKFDNFRSKSLKKIEKAYKEEVQKIKEQNIEIRINNNNYSGKVLSYPIVSNIHPTNYKCKWWEYNVNTVFKIIVEVCLGCPYGHYKHDTEKELTLINEAQFKFVTEYFKESYEVLGIKPHRQITIDDLLKENIK